MKLHVLVDNNTYIDQYYCGEPAVSYYIEDEKNHILFDTGYSDLLIKNAKKMNLDLSRLDAIVLSHGHNDHTRGLKYLFNQYDLTNTKLIAHPNVFNEKIYDGQPIGAPVTQEDIQTQCQLALSTAPSKISPNIYFLGEIPQYNDFETRRAIGSCISKDEFCDDYVLDDSAITYQSDNGIYIITGCSHSGICNIIEHAKKVTRENRVLGVLGGFHLFELDSRLDKTINYFVENKIPSLYPCHCVSFLAKAHIHQSITIQEVGVGLTLNW